MQMGGEQKLQAGKGWDAWGKLSQPAGTGEALHLRRLARMWDFSRAAEDLWGQREGMCALTYGWQTALLRTLEEQKSIM